MMFVLANPAEADHIPESGGLPENCLKFEGRSIGDEGLSGSIDGVSFTFTNWVEKPGEPGEYISVDITVTGLHPGQWLDWQLKSGSGADEGSITTNGTVTVSVSDTSAISHVTICLEGERTTTTTVEDTTTTTVDDTTTTTVDDTTTTTVDDTTTTTVDDTTTTTVDDTTTTTVEDTTTIPDEVLALVFVTVEGECVVDDDKGNGEITVTVSIDDAATVVIRDGDGDVVATVTQDSVLTVPEGDTYTWEATPTDDFEFAEDFVSSGEVDIEECTPTEVKDLEVLPFTGIETEALATIAAVLSAIGLLVILATRRVEN